MRREEIERGLSWAYVFLCLLFALYGAFRLVTR